MNRMVSIRERFERALSGLREFFAARDVVLAYVFGSVAQDRERADSDLDIAVLFSPRVPRDRYFDLTIELNTEIAGATHTNVVDVVVLNTATPLLAYEVLTKGRRILGSQEARVEWEVDALKRYFDTEPRASGRPAA